MDAYNSGGPQTQPPTTSKNESIPSIKRSISQLYRSGTTKDEG